MARVHFSPSGTGRQKVHSESRLMRTQGVSRFTCAGIWGPIFCSASGNLIMLYSNYGILTGQLAHSVEERLAAEHELVDYLRARPAVGVGGHLERSARVHQVPDARRDVVLELHLLVAVPRCTAHEAPPKSTSFTVIINEQGTY